MESHFVSPSSSSSRKRKHGSGNNSSSSSSASASASAAVVASVDLTKDEDEDATEAFGDITVVLDDPWALPDLCVTADSIDKIRSVYSISDLPDVTRTTLSFTDGRLRVDRRGTTFNVLCNDSTQNGDYNGRYAYCLCGIPDMLPWVFQTSMIEPDLSDEKNQQPAPPRAKLKGYAGHFADSSVSIAVEYSAIRSVLAAMTSAGISPNDVDAEVRCVLDTSLIQGRRDLVKLIQGIPPMGQFARMEIVAKTPSDSLVRSIHCVRIGRLTRITDMYMHIRERPPAPVGLALATLPVTQLHVDIDCADVGTLSLLSGVPLLRWLHITLRGCYHRHDKKDRIFHGLGSASLPLLTRLGFMVAEGCHQTCTVVDRVFKGICSRAPNITHLTLLHLSTKDEYGVTEGMLLAQISGHTGRPADKTLQRLLPNLLALRTYMHRRGTTSTSFEQFPNLIVVQQGALPVIYNAKRAGYLISWQNVAVLIGLTRVARYVPKLPEIDKLIRGFVGGLEFVDRGSNLFAASSLPVGLDF